MSDVRNEHTPPLDVVDTAVDLILRAPVERRGVDMDNERLAGQNINMIDNILTITPKVIEKLQKLSQNNKQS